LRPIISFLNGLPLVGASFKGYPGFELVFLLPFCLFPYIELLSFKDKIKEPTCVNKGDREFNAIVLV